MASSTDLPWNREIISRQGHWGKGLALAVLLLDLQLIYFNAETISHHRLFRLGLEKAARQLHYPLPSYKNLAEILVLQSSLTLVSSHKQRFRVLIKNQAAFAQAYPNLKLTLEDYAGHPYGFRIFHPKDYLTKTPVAALMLPSTATAISLNLAATQTKVGGYTLELIN